MAKIRLRFKERVLHCGGTIRLSLRIPGEVHSRMSRMIGEAGSGGEPTATSRADKVWSLYIDIVSS